ncbi:Disease resistance protein [Morus notabilis]|nr:probable disease resistance protein At1g61300 [Morus notabilis]XP_024029948.1 probable disease resistance protein At1g61300 [Morus notabilis]EXC50911.1 Disease resistance protein [Morus notabilis]
MLTKEVARRAMDEKLFSEVVAATVSQTPNHELIQQEVAEKLGLKFREKSVPIRANRLQFRLRQEKKILIILDDIWENLELNEVGMSFGDAQKECKILLISRFQNVLCNDMEAEKNFQVGPLTDDEAISLFKKMVGDWTEKSDFRDLATQIIEKCGGIPATIAKVASELKNKRLFVWKDVLTQLKRSAN